MFVLLLELLFFRVCDYLTGIVYHRLNNQLRHVCDICKAQDPFSKISSSGDVKLKSLEGFVCYLSRAKVLKLLAKYFPILARVKTSLVRVHAGIWVPETIEHDILEPFDSDNTA